MKHDFSNVPHANIPRSKFNRSSGHKTTMDFGDLVPIFVDEVYPGDTFNLNLSAFGRLATPINPVMDNMYLDTFFFFVPTRLLWDNWEKFNGEQTNPDDSTDYLIPKVGYPVGGYNTGDLADHFGLPIDVEVGAGVVNALPFRAYNLIYNEWFRDENLVDSVNVPTDDGPDSYPTDYTNGALLKRGKRHDYFTSCLPWPQKGDSVNLPLGTTAPVELIEGLNVAGIMNRAFDDDPTGAGDITTDANGDLLIGPTDVFGYYDPNGTLEVNLESATATTINDLRQAFQVQRMLERDARGGTRYTEIVRSHFGVTSPDSRLQRPEYLGGGSNPINTTPIAQTSSTDATTPQGNLAAFGTVGVSKNGFVKSFTEHGYIIGIASARADLTYQQGINKLWLRDERFDFYWPSFAHLGEQAVENREIYAQGTAADDEVFGYQERYAELRYKPSLVTGAFRSDAAASLDSWHLSQEFTDLPVLGETFITENPPIDRVVAVPSEPDLILDMYFHLNCVRPLPMFGTPGNIDRF
jgi:hypothetical protein